MNCEHHNRKRESDNELICTAYSPKPPREQPVNKAESPMNPSHRRLLRRELFTIFHRPFPDGEKVLKSTAAKKRLDNRSGNFSLHSCRQSTG
jgi:hypothetical protein